jgi:hypothetical protein
MRPMLSPVSSEVLVNVDLRHDQVWGIYRDLKKHCVYYYNMQQQTKKRDGIEEHH